MSSITARIGVLVLLGAAATALAAEREYEVRFHTGSGVGNKYRFSASSASRTRVTMTGGGRNRENEYVALHELEATMEVLKVDEHGNILQARFTIDKLTKTEADREKEVLSRGGESHRRRRVALHDVQGGWRATQQ